MQSLKDFSADKLISSLPKECLDILVDRYLGDKKYDLTTFVEISDDQDIPQSGYWYLSFHKNILLSIEASVPIINWLIKPKTHDMLIYCIPRSGWNAVFYIDGETSPQSTVISTFKEPPLDGKVFIPWYSVGNTSSHEYKKYYSIAYARFFIPS